MIGRLARTMAVAGVALGVLAPSAGAAVGFAPANDYTVDAPDSLAQGAVNGDAFTDLVGVGTGSATVLFGNGAGAFAPGAPFTIQSPASGVAAGSLRNNGVDDLVVARSGGGGTVDVYLNDGTGVFGSGTSQPPGGSPATGNYQDVALGRVSADGFIDAAAVKEGPPPAKLAIFFGDGNGNLLAPTETDLGTSPRAIALGDVDADGDNDLAIAGNNDLYVSLNNGAGAFGTPFPLGTTETVEVAIADVDGNGRSDVIGVKADGALAVALSTAGSLNGFASPLDQPAGGGATAVAAADMDSDLVTDLVVSNNDGRVTPLVGRGDGRFDPGTSATVGGSPQDVLIGDYNRDGNPDAATAIPGANRVSVLLSRAPGLSFSPPAASFGDQAVGTTSEVRTIRLTNSGPPRGRVGAVSLSGASEFAIVADGCSGRRVGLNESCDISLRFAPAAVGAREARLTVPVANAGAPQVLSVAGTGATPTLRVGTCANLFNGTAAAETINGTAEGDNIFGFGGNDVLNGLGKRDCLAGGDGNDRLNGADDSDTLEGGNGNDVESGGAGNDRMSGGSGRDRLSGGSGNDSMNGGSSNDSLSGSSGNDTLSGSTGNDKLSGGSGKNKYSGGPGNDTINARNRKTETIDCGTGRDRATVDRKDKVKRCERVSRSRR